MSKLNPKAPEYKTIRLAGGHGPVAASQSNEALLRRAVMASLLWENLAYENGKSNADNVAALVPKVDAQTVANIAYEARRDQKLRSMPLFIAREMLRHPKHSKLVGGLLPHLLDRPDMASDLLALYWKDGKKPLANQLKIGLAASFRNWNEYQLTKWNKKDRAVKLLDIMRMVHPEPKDSEQSHLWAALRDDKLPTATTWEVELSKGGDKKASWEKLLREDTLKDMAFLRNLRNMTEANVSRSLIISRMGKVNSSWLLPLNFFSAAKHAPEYQSHIEAAMLRCFNARPRLPGTTVFVVDESNSMQSRISAKSDWSRHDVARAMAVLAKSSCEDAIIYATAGRDGYRTHKTQRVPDFSGFVLSEAIAQIGNGLGGGGIFTRQVLEFIKDDLPKNVTPDRIIIFSDSQDCDLPNLRKPAPFGRTNYIVDVSAEARGINYEGVWTAEVSGWSDHFIDYIAALEGVAVEQGDEDEQ